MGLSTLKSWRKQPSFQALIASSPASDAELRASWRPVLVARNLMFSRMPVSVHVGVENVGRGPALEARAELHGFDLPDPGLARPAGVVIAPDAESLTSLVWQLALRNSTIGQLICQDVSGGVCVTTFIIDAEKRTIRNVEVTADYSDVFAVRWWQRPFQKRIVGRRLGEYR